MFRHNRKNFYILLVDVIAFYVFFTLWDVNTVIPVFLDKLGSPSWTIGLANSIKQLGFIIPQLVLLPHIYKIGSLVRFIRKVLFVNRPQLVAFLILLLLLKPGKPMVIAFIISFAVLNFGEGLTLLPWMDLLGRTVQPNTRGRFYGAVQVLSGLAALGSGYVISKYIENTGYPFPVNFVLIFGLGSVIILPSLYLFKIAEDPVLPEISFRPNWRISAVNCFKNKEFILMLVVQILISADALALPFYIIMVRHRFAWLASSTGTYVFLSIIGGVLGGILWGYLSDKKGNRTAIIFIALFNVLTSGSFLITQFIQSKAVLAAILAPGFILAGMVAGGWLGFVNYMLDLAGDDERPFYIAVDNAILLPIALLPILGGIIRDFGGDLTLYVITTTSMIIGFILSFRLKEPRQ
ncbi:MAG: MFS transporter [Eubacteriales bacterium]